MRSLALLPDLSKLPTVENSGRLSLSESVSRLRATDNESFAIEVSEGVDEALEGLSAANVSDEVSEAYGIAFPNSEAPVHEYYENALANGERSVTGFMSNLKGKVAELKAEDILEDRFSGFNFEIAQDLNQQVWDLRGISSDGTEEILVQVKMGGEGYASDVLSRMQDDPDVLFAVSSEIYDKIVERSPELADQLIDLETSNLNFTSELQGDLEILASNSGFDIPDTLSDILPYIGEVILGIRLIMDIVSTERELKEVALPDRSRMHALRVLVLMSKFGVTTVCTTVGGMAGASAGTLGLPGVGTAVAGIAGSLTGVGVATMLNRRLKDRTMQIAFYLTGLDEDDVFYLRNKPAIDGIGTSLASTSAA